MVIRRSYFWLSVFVGLSSMAQIHAQKAAIRPTSAGLPKFECLKTLTKSDIDLLIGEIKTKNPESYKRLVDDVELRKSQVESLRQLLAFSCQAVGEGIANDPVNARELAYIRTQSIASEYDKVTNGKSGSPPFGSVTDGQITAFYSDPRNDSRFDEFLRVKLELLKQSNSPNYSPSADETSMAKDFFAKISIAEAQSNQKAVRLGPIYAHRIRLESALQQAQFLAKFESEKLAEKVKVSDSEIAEYIVHNPEFSTVGKKTEAERILAMAKAGEDFAELANKYSEDPGNGNKNGGLYANVPKGTMVKPFEQAALSIKPGTIYPSVVETDFGYHIIKLERVDESKVSNGVPEITYDVRHILISTMRKGPSPDGRDIPLKEYVRSQIETEKEKALVAEVVAKNPVQIADIEFGAPVTKRPPVRHRKK